MEKVMMLLLALFTGACSSTIYTEKDNQITVHTGFGGLVRPITKRYEKWEAEGRTLIIDGHVLSADAFAAFSYPGACYTENAVWSPHAYSNMGLYRLTGETEIATRKLPEPLQRWFRGNMAFYDWIGFAVVDYEQLLEIWPEGACNKRGARSATLQTDVPSISIRRHDVAAKWTAASHPPRER